MTYQLKYKQQNRGNLAMYDSSKESGNKFHDMDRIHLHEVLSKILPIFPYYQFIWCTVQINPHYVQHNNKNLNAYNPQVLY